MGANEAYVIGRLKEERLTEAIDLIKDVFLEFVAPDYEEEGVKEFMRFIESESIGRMLSSGEMCMWSCAGKQDEMLGVLAEKGQGGHISLLFVRGDSQKKGIARALLNAMMKEYCESPPKEVTVNASPNAQKTYRKLGFFETGEEQTINGIRFIPMSRPMEKEE